VPSLREALREEEANSANSGEGDSKGRGGRPKRGKGKGKSEADGEKIDGRAGPRSENVVLSRSKFLAAPFFLSSVVLICFIASD
jgi:hypothetical protein